MTKLDKAELELRVLHEDVVTARKAQDDLHGKLQYLERRLDQVGRFIIDEKEKEEKAGLGYVTHLGQ